MYMECIKQDKSFTLTQNIKFSHLMDHNLNYIHYIGCWITSEKILKLPPSKHYGT